MANDPTRPDARDDGDDSTSTRPDGTATDGTPADQSHADSPAEKAESEEDRGGVNPDAPGPHTPPPSETPAGGPDLTKGETTSDLSAPPASRGEDTRGRTADTSADPNKQNLPAGPRADGATPFGAGADADAERAADELEAAVQELKKGFALYEQFLQADEDPATSVSAGMRPVSGTGGGPGITDPDEDDGSLAARLRSLAVDVQALGRRVATAADRRNA